MEIRRLSGAKRFLGFAVFSCTVASPAFAVDRYDVADGATGWAWARLSHGQKADFNDRCHTTPFDPRSTTDTRWADPCRQLPSWFLANLLVQKLTTTRSTGVHIVGAVISGDVNLRFVKLDRALILENCRINGSIDLNQARTD